MDNSSALYLIIRRLRTPMFVLIIAFGVSILGLTLIPGIDDRGNPYQMSFFDAFYFVSYMASTIGFGEAPYTFTYSQRLWVSFCIYLSVIGWFYAIGSIIALMQDKVLASQIAVSQFIRDVKRINEPFIIFVGYNLLAKNIIQMLNDAGIQSVVIEKDAGKIDEMVLANYNKEVPALQGDINDSDTLMMAGITKPQCMAVVSLSSDDTLNLHAALSAKLLNKSVKVIVEATYEEFTENYNTIGIDVVENPFKLIAKRLYMALKAPSLLMLEQWIYGEPLELRTRDMIPTEGRFIVCGYGRMGRALEVALKRAGLEYIFIESDPELVERKKEDERHMLVGEGQDKRVLLEARVRESACIIAGMDDDFINLTIVMAAKRLNPDIFTIARQNNINDNSIFNAAGIDRVVRVQRMLINETFIAVARPLSERFLRLMKYQGEDWGAGLVMTLKQLIGDNPGKTEVRIDAEHAHAVTQKLRDGATLKVDVLYHNRADFTRYNNMVALLLVRGEEEFLFPDPGTALQEGDSILFAGDEEAFEDLEYILENIYELEYVLCGKKERQPPACHIAFKGGKVKIHFEEPKA